MNEHEPRPLRSGEAELARTGETADFRRLDVAYGRFADRITAGITQALAEHTEIPDDTARCIAHVLGRAYGRESALADYGRTGEGNYLSLRDEYLALYGDEHASAVTKELIDWLGTYLVQRENTGTGRQFMNEHLPPKLGQLLVRTSVRVGDDNFVVNIPADWDSGEEDGLIELLTDLQLPEDDALQAFLALPDVSAGVDDIMESFHDSFVAIFDSPEDAVHGLMEVDEWEQEVNEYAAERGLIIDRYSVDYPMLLERLSDAYDLAEWRGRVHVFYR
jgi:hypothetical protein